MKVDHGGANSVDVVWPQFLAMAGIGALFFAFALARFRQAIAQMA